MSLIQKIKDEISKILSETKGNTNKLEEQIHTAIDDVAAKHGEDKASDNARIARPTAINSYAHETVAAKPANAEEAVAAANPVPSEDTIEHEDGSVTNPDGSIALPDGSVKNVDGTVTNADGSVTNLDGSVTPAPEKGEDDQSKA